MKREKLKKLPQKVVERACDDMVRNIYKVNANYVGPVYLSVIDNGDQNIAVRLTFTEAMLLSENKQEYNPVSAVVMNIVDFQKFYNLATTQLQTLREAKKIA